MARSRNRSARCDKGEIKSRRVLYSRFGSPKDVMIEQNSGEDVGTTRRDISLAFTLHCFCYSHKTLPVAGRTPGTPDEFLWYHKQLVKVMSFHRIVRYYSQSNALQRPLYEPGFKAPPASGRIPLAFVQAVYVPRRRFHIAMSPLNGRTYMQEGHEGFCSCWS